MSPRDLKLSALLAAACFGLYASTACRTVAGGDSAEFAIVFARFGVAHAPGYALQSLLSGLLVHALPFAPQALLANLLSGLWAAAGAGLAYAWLRRLDVTEAAAAFAALALGSGKTFWSQAVVAEVYTFDALLLLLALHAGLGLGLHPNRRSAILAGLAIGSWLLHRSVNLLYLPGLALAVSVAGRRPPRALLPGLAMGLTLALLSVLYLPLAASAGPPLLSGEISGLGDSLRHATGGAFGHLLSFAPARALGRLGVFASNLPRDLGLALPLALLPLVAQSAAGQRARSVLGLLLLAAMNLAFAAVYEIPDIEAYFVPAIVAIALLAGFGADWLSRSFDLAHGWRPALAGAGALGAVINFGMNDRSSDRILERFTSDVLEVARGPTLIIVHGDTVANLLLYARYVENRAPQLTTLYTTLTQPWYHAQIRRLHAGKPWPDFDARESWESRSARTIANFIGDHRVFVSAELDPAVLLARGPLGQAWQEKYEIVPNGLLAEIVPRAPTKEASLERRLRTAMATVESLGRTVQDLGQVSLSSDIDAKITLLQYSAALARAGATLESAQPALARRAYQTALALDPEAFERAYREEQEFRTGEKVRLLDIGRNAAAGLTRAESRLRPADP